ncbi:hypothetical protein IQ238_16160 [Pleurocapsales cyanobacterium LEGE 06147]|nr:hypothetical protein [Pleurocapsales cyanobacterium LEGE 06147]
MTQLLSLPSQLQQNQLERLKSALEDLVERLEIEPDFTIRHPDYKPLELSPEAVERFKKLPQELQDKYLSQQLQGFIYGIYYNSSLKTALAKERDERAVVDENLENNTFLGVDLDFYQKLHDSNCGEGYFDPGWQAIAKKDDGSLVVTKNGLTLHLEVERHLSAEQQQAKIGDLVAVRLPKNRVQNGFYLAVGNIGLSKDHLETTVRIYFHLTADGAVAMMKSLTEELNQLAIPFSFKALYNPSSYQRDDSAVLYIERNNYPTVRSVLQNIYTQHQTYFEPEVPLFTKLLAPGLALAEEPNYKFSHQDSFGTNRCQIVVNGLLAARQQGDRSPAKRMIAIQKQFYSLGIELERSYLNANSEDIYTPLELSLTHG